MIEQADRYTLTTGSDGRGVLTLALRRHARATTDSFLRAQRYWACSPGGAQPRWLALPGGPGHLQRSSDFAADAQEAKHAHAAAEAYLPSVRCSGCGDRSWKPLNRVAVTQYVLTGATGACLTCHDPSTVTVAPPRPAPLTGDLIPAHPVQTRGLPEVTVRLEGTAAAMLWNATGGDMRIMSSLVTDLVARNFGIR